MSDILRRILATKREEIEAARRLVGLAQMKQMALAADPPRGFARALADKVAAGRPAVIAEIKRGSPSRGVIRAADFDPQSIARAYELHGAACLSVLTDREYFGGSPEDLKSARAACGLPVLRKDFIVDPYQVYEARAWGADCILLIMDAVPDSLQAELEGLAIDLGMDVLAESHDATQLDRALRLETPLMGINNRDLRTFETHLETTLALAGRVLPPRLVVAESGISTPEDVRRLRESNVSAYLIGGAFMAAPDPGEALGHLFEAW